jgi:methionyl-tRNA synthetase
MPKTSEKIKKLLNIKEDIWAPINYDSDVKLGEISVLFNRIDIKDIDMTKGEGDTFKQKYMK